MEQEIVIHTTHQAWGIFWICFLVFLFVYAAGWWIVLPRWYERRKHHNITEHKRFYTEHRPDRYLSDSRNEAMRWALLWPVYDPWQFIRNGVIEHMTADEREQMKLAEARQIIADYEASQFPELEPEPEPRKSRIPMTLEAIWPFNAKTKN